MGYTSYSFLPLISSFFIFVLGFFVWVKKPRVLLYQIFLLYCFTVAIWLFGTFKLFNAQSDYSKILWDRFVYIGVVFIPVFLYHFGLIYCNVKKQKKLLVLAYLLAFIFLPLSQTDKFVSGLYRYSWGVHTIARFYHHLFLVYFFFYFILFFVNLIKCYKRALGRRKKEIKYIMLGYGVLDLIGPLAFLPAYGIPVYPVVFLCAIPFVLFLAYAIVRFEALKMSIISVEVLVTLLSVLSLIQLSFSKDGREFVFNSFFFLIVVIFAFLMVHSVKKEIKQKEEMKNLAKTLKQANTRLKEMDRQKTEFLSIASHQLRTPLSVLKGYIELISEGVYGKVNGELVKILHDMDEGNERLVKLVDEFLDITRVEQDKMKFNFQKIQIEDLISEAITELSEKATHEKMKIIWREPENKTRKVYADPKKIYHILVHFIDNAIKYGNISGKKKNDVIEVKLIPNHKGLSVKVIDSGLGFTKRDEVNFFQKFYRGRNVKGVNVTGTGLGLYVASKFIEGHNGKVWARSKGLGKGSEFGFWLPYGKG